MDNLDLSPYLNEDAKEAWRSNTLSRLDYWEWLECLRLCDVERYEKRLRFHEYVKHLFDIADNEGLDTANSYYEVRQWYLSVKKSYIETGGGTTYDFWYMRNYHRVRYLYNGDWSLHHYHAIPLEMRSNNRIIHNPTWEKSLSEKPIEKPVQLSIF